jgi:membrane fusion protein, multidrug efflux system
VQRLPVRIALDPKELEAHPLRIGLSVLAKVDLHDEKGPALEDAPNTVYQTPVFEDYGSEASGDIARIIAQNAGGDVDSVIAAAPVLRNAPRVAAAR